MVSKIPGLAYYYPEGHQAHQAHGHPERPERIERIRQALIQIGCWDEFPHLEPAAIPQYVLESVHDPAYLVLLKEVCKYGGYLDADTYTTHASWELALNAAGGAIAVASAVWQGRVRKGFALTRPPGHHATAYQGMGFCLINNVAVAAEHLILEEKVQKVAIVDLDLHHGNGTQDIFWKRNDVLYISTHQSPLYPGSGGVEETGAGPGSGYTANFPLPPGSGDQAFDRVMGDFILPLLHRFGPQMILVSFGFDTHWRDPLGSLLLSATGYQRLIAALVAYADENAAGKLALILEGGYDLDAGAACSQAVVSALLVQPWQDPIGLSEQPETTYWMTMARRAREILKL
jgi:acetoin utilization deacetylase AcuC-like enzyme